MNLVEILKSYTNPTAAATNDVRGHFDAVATEVAPHELGGGVAAALRSDATGSFGKTISDLFSRSNPDQQAGLLNQLSHAIGPSVLAGAGSGMLGKIFGSGDTRGTITPAQAAQVPATDVEAMADHAEKHDGSIVDRIGGFYAQHPALVKSLGVAALGVVMSHLGEKRQA